MEFPWVSLRLMGLSKQSNSGHCGALVRTRGHLASARSSVIHMSLACSLSVQELETQSWPNVYYGLAQIPGLCDTPEHRPMLSLRRLCSGRVPGSFQDDSSHSFLVAGMVKGTGWRVAGPAVWTP